MTAPPEADATAIVIAPRNLIPNENCPPSGHERHQVAGSRQSFKMVGEVERAPAPDSAKSKGVCGFAAIKSPVSVSDRFALNLLGRFCQLGANSQTLEQKSLSPAAELE